MGLRGAPCGPRLGGARAARRAGPEVPVVALGEAAIKNARPRLLSPYYSDMSLVMAEQFNASVKGARSPEEAADTLDDRLQEIVEQAS